VDGISRQTIFRKSAILSPTTRIAEGDFRVPKGGCRHQPKNGFPKECDSCVTASRICTRMMPLPNNDGVHRVAAGGCSKNRKPASRNSGATLCYLLVVSVDALEHSNESEEECLPERLFAMGQYLEDRSKLQE
jgi:hypothetical protein